TRCALRGTRHPDAADGHRACRPGPSPWPGAASVSLVETECSPTENNPIDVRPVVTAVTGTTVARNVTSLPDARCGPPPPPLPPPPPHSANPHTRHLAQPSLNAPSHPHPATPPLTP